MSDRLMICRLALLLSIVLLLNAPIARADTGPPSPRDVADEAAEGVENIKKWVSDDKLTELDWSKRGLPNENLNSVDGMPSLRIVRIGGGPGLSDPELKHFSGLAELRTFEIRHTSITGTGLSYLRGATKLESLILEGDCLTDEALKNLGNWPELSSLELSNEHWKPDDSDAVPHITDEGMRYLTLAPKLRRLLLRDLFVGDAAFQPIGKLTKLQELEAYLMHSDGSGLRYLKDLQSLKVLGLCAYGTSGDKFDNLAPLTALDDLTLVGVGDADGLGHLAKIPNLSRLTLRRAPFRLLSSATLSRVGIRSLRELRKLASLTITDSNIQPGAFAAFGELTRLRSLELRNNFTIDEKDNVTANKDGLADSLRKLVNLKRLVLGSDSVNFGNDDVLEPIKNLTQLEELDVSWCRDVSDEGLKYLKGLVQLRELQLGGEHLTDDGLQYLAGLAKLRKLGLRQTPAWRPGEVRITDRGLRHLGGLHDLEEIDLRCTWVSVKGVQFLLDHCPKLKKVDVDVVAGFDESSEGKGVSYDERAEIRAQLAKRAQR